MKKAAILTSAALIAIASPPALAIPFGGSTVYRTIEGGKTYICVGGLQPGQVVNAKFTFIPTTVTRTADACGQITIPVTATNSNPVADIGSGGMARRLDSSLPTRLKPSCVGGTLSEARPQDYKTPEGDLVAVGLVPSQPVSLRLIGNKIRKLTANQCGFARFTATTTIPLEPGTEFTLPPDAQGMEDWQVGGLPVATAPPRCIRINDIPTGYKPTNW